MKFITFLATALTPTVPEPHWTALVVLGVLLMLIGVRWVRE